jgi:hypothetical protein
MWLEPDCIAGELERFAVPSLLGLQDAEQTQGLGIGRVGRQRGAVQQLGLGQLSRTMQY